MTLIKETEIEREEPQQHPIFNNYQHLGSKEHWLGVEKKSKVGKPKSTTYSSSDIYRIFTGFIWDFSFYKEQSTSFHRETDQI